MLHNNSLELTGQDWVMLSTYSVSWDKSNTNFQTSGRLKIFLKTDVLDQKDMTTKCNVVSGMDRGTKKRILVKKTIKSE